MALFNRWLKRLSGLIGGHFGVLTYFLDPVSCSAHRTKYQQLGPAWQYAHFLFPAAYLATVMLVYGDLPLDLQHAFSSAADRPARPPANELLYFPAGMFFHEVWPQADIAYLLGSAIAAVVLASFGRVSFSAAGRYEALLGNKREGDHQRLIIKEKKLSKAVSAEILAAHRRLHRALFMAVFFVWAAALLYMQPTALLVNHSHELRSPADGLFLLLIVPLHLFYWLYGVFGVAIFIVMLCSFLNARQRHQLKRLKKVEGVLGQRLCDGQGQPNCLRNCELLEAWCWRKYLAINGSIISLAVDIERSSALWTASLTIYLGGLITLQCYEVYIVFFKENASFAAVFVFLYAIVEIGMVQFLLIRTAAKVVKTNGAIERVNRVLAFHFSQLFNLKRRSSKTGATAVNLKELLKAEWLQQSHRLKPYCMHLLDNYRITSKTFYMSITYNTMLFLVIFK
ncbi:hypothetical protein TYRP_023098, partial [Tyrophagus putrescentiae]